MFIKLLKSCSFSLAAVVFFAMTLFADNAAMVLQSLTIEGLERTEESVVREVLALPLHQEITISDIEEAITRLENMRLFSSVSQQLLIEPKGTRLSIKVKEKWTTIPIAKLASGGGVTQVILGVYDPNIFGRYLELGGQYERLGQANSGVLWLKDPRFFSNKLELNLQLWNSNRLRTKYYQDTLGVKEKMGFLHKRKKAYASLLYRFWSQVRLGLEIESHSDSFSFDYIDQELIDKTEALGGLPPESDVLFYGALVEMGSLSYKDNLAFGTQLSFKYRRGVSQDKDLDDFDELTGNLTSVHTVFERLTFAQRLGVGTTSTQILQYWHYLGGLQHIRGFADNRFAGRNYWLSNTELRALVYRSDWLLLQGVGFFDSVSAKETTKELNKSSAESLGFGLRIIAPKVYRLVGRLDFAKPLKKSVEMPISFGVQQFF